MGIVKQRDDQPGASRLVLKGEVDLHSSNALRLELLALVKKRVPRIELDMAGVTYIDSSGLATLIECVKACQAYGGAVRLSAVQPKVMSVFKLAHLHNFFEIA